MKTIIFSTAIALIILSTPLETFADPLIVTTQEVTNISESSAIANGIIATDPDFWFPIREVDAYGLYWNTTGVLDTATDNTSDRDDADLPVEFSIAMKDLLPGTTYYVWAYADPPYFRPVYGNRLSFTTLQPPEVSTQDVTEISSTSAVGHGTISVLGIPAPFQHGVCWDTKKNPTIDDEKTEEGAVSESSTFTSKITGLKANKKYYVRAYATNTAGTVYGQQVTFITASGIPVVTTQATTNITIDSATANATLVDMGNPTATQYGVCWATSSMPDDDAENCIDNGEAEAEGPFQVEITGLISGTVYYLRAFASNETDVYHYGAEVSFVTLNLPNVSTQAVTNISTNDATGNGTIIGLGNPKLTAHGLCWNTDGLPNITDRRIDLGSADEIGPFFSQMTDLIPSTTYFVRAYATNDAGTIYGDERSLTTISDNITPMITGQTHPLSTDEEAPLILNLFDLFVTDVDNTYPTGFTLLIQDGINYTHLNNTITPKLNFNGKITVTVKVDDGEASNSLSNPFELSVTVNPINDFPVISNIPNQTVAEGSAFATINLDNYVTDVDNIDNQIIWSTAGSSKLLVNITDRVATVTIPDENWNGSETIMFQANDPDGLFDSDQVTFTVNEVNDAPQITSTPGTTVNTGIEYTYNATATDVDNDNNSLKWSLASLPPGMKLAPSTGSSVTVSWTPGPGIDTSELVKLRVTDGKATTTEIFTITVTNLPAVNVISIDSVSTNTATVNSEVVNLGIPALTQRGVCWSTSENPTLGDSCINKGVIYVTGAFTSQITDLAPGTLYYVRTYATNDVGTVYSDQISFATTDSAITPRATLSGTPTPLTNATAYNLQVGGLGVVSYKHRLDNGAWSEEQPVSQKIAFDIFDEGTHMLAVIGKAGSGIWQAEQNPTLFSWVVDTTPPNAVLFNFPNGIVGLFAGDILVQCGDVTAYSYSLDGDTWSTIYPVSVPIVLPDLSDGPHTLAVIGTDLAGNGQEADNATEITWEKDAGVPTALLTNLPDAVTSQTSITIYVTTPDGGIVVEEYYYRFKDSTRWFHGYAHEAIAVSGLCEGEYTLCVNAGSGDDVWQDRSDGTSSTDSATCFNWRVDLTPAEPAALSAENMAAPFTEVLPMVDSKSIELSWTWTSIDDAETISRYRVWYSLSPISRETLKNAVEVFCDILPGKEGFEERLIIDGLIPSEQYYFALTSIDTAGNESALSNVAVLATDILLPEIHALELAQGGLVTDNGAADALMITGAYFLGTAGGNRVRFESDTTSFELNNRPGTAEKTSVEIPLGVPTGTYRVQVINKHGASLNSIDRVVINEAPTRLPTVKSVSPFIVPIGTRTLITIFGENFSETPSEINLLDPEGTATALMDIFWIDPTTIKAVVDVAEDFSEGQYYIQVVNADGQFNEISAARIEIYHPIDLAEVLGAVTTSGIVRIEDGLVPTYTILNNDNQASVGELNQNYAKLKIFLEPGTFLEVQGQTDWMPYSGTIFPPRVISVNAFISDGIGTNIIPFNMGSDQKLRLGGGAKIFLITEATLPSYITEPMVYCVEPGGSVTLAGINGTWRGINIAAGGSLLATHYNMPETGLTTFTLGILLDHMSNFAIGPASSNYSDDDNDQYTENQGDCDDTDALVNPESTEIPYNGKDDDCNISTLDNDLDHDGFLLANDCDDRVESVNPDAAEICGDGIDNNCDNSIDEGCDTNTTTTGGGGGGGGCFIDTLR